MNACPLYRLNDPYLAVAHEICDCFRLRLDALQALTLQLARSTHGIHDLVLHHDQHAVRARRRVRPVREEHVWEAVDAQREVCLWVRGPTCCERRSVTPDDGER